MMQTAVSIGRFAFIDDTDLCVLGHPTAEETAKHMQQWITHWEGFLQTMGGALVPNKCFWYLIDQVWSDGKWCYQPINHTQATLWVCDSQGQLHTIPHLEVTDACQTLGI